MVSKSIVRRYLRPLIPFPKKRTLLRYFPSFETRNIGRILKNRNINTVIDIGANKGQFGIRLRSAGFKGEIISIEPNREIHKELLKVARRDPRWQILDPVAVGDQDGSGVLLVPTDTAMASLSPILDRGRPIETTQPIAVRRLDAIIDELKLPDSAVLALKIDVQGTEHKVLDGALNARAAAILIEVSLIPIYEGEQSYLTILDRLRAEGFDAAFFSQVTSTKLYGEQYQVDTLLVRRR